MKLLLSLDKGKFFIFVTIAFVGCNKFFGENSTVNLPNNPDITCKEYLKSLPSFWIEKDKGHYEFMPNSPTFYGGFVQNTNVCFQGFSVKWLKKHLGEPNVETTTELIYFMTEACLTRNRDCNVQVFKIENDFFKETLLISPRQYNEGIN